MCDAQARVLSYYQVRRVSDGSALLAALCELVASPVDFRHQGAPYSEHDAAEWGDWKVGVHHDQRLEFKSVIPPSPRGLRHASVGEMDHMLSAIMEQSLGDAYISAETMQSFLSYFDGPDYDSRSYRDTLHRRLLDAPRGVHFLVTCFQYHTLNVQESFDWPTGGVENAVTRGWRWVLVFFNVHSGKFTVVDGYKTGVTEIARNLLDFMRREPQFPLINYVRAYPLEGIGHITTSCGPEDDRLSGDFCAYALGSALLTLNLRSRLFQKI